MKRLAAAVIIACGAASPGAHADTADLRIARAGSQPSARGPGEYFTGRVVVDPLFPATAPSRMSGALVTFEPGARSAWHSHPVGQVLIVTAGMGWVQRESGPVEEIRPGDVVWIPPGVKHWHGATAATSMAHIATLEATETGNTVWMEHVSEGQYLR